MECWGSTNPLLEIHFGFKPETAAPDLNVAALICEFRFDDKSASDRCIQSVQTCLSDWNHLGIGEMDELRSLNAPPKPRRSVVICLASAHLRSA